MQSIVFFLVMLALPLQVQISSDETTLSNNAICESLDGGCTCKKKVGEICTLYSEWEINWELVCFEVE